MKSAPRTGEPALGCGGGFGERPCGSVANLSLLPSSGNPLGLKAALALCVCNPRGGGNLKSGAEKGILLKPILKHPVLAHPI
jgi:hypothetical protein